MKKFIKKSKTFFFEDKPLFGMDIGHDTVRVVQFDTSRKEPRLKGYGAVTFNEAGYQYNELPDGCDNSTTPCTGFELVAQGTLFGGAAPGDNIRVTN